MCGAVASLGRTTRTVQGARRTTPSATEPIKTRDSPRRPWVPTTTRSASTSGRELRDLLRRRVEPHVSDDSQRRHPVALAALCLVALEALLGVEAKLLGGVAERHAGKPWTARQLELHARAVRAHDVDQVNVGVTAPERELERALHGEIAGPGEIDSDHDRDSLRLGHDSPRRPS